MKKLNEWNILTDKHRFTRNIIAFDWDGTLTNEVGETNSKILEGLEKLHKANKKIVIVTGRPMAWADAFMRIFPLDAVIAENGACLLYWQEGRLLRKERDAWKILFWNENNYTSENLRIPQREAEAVFSEVKSMFPQVKLASDQPFRYYDLAIDFCEDVNPPLSFIEAEEIRKIFEKHGAKAKVSHIHVNGWWGSFDKQSGLRFLVEKLWQNNLEESVIYVGDSPNDAPLFSLPLISVAVQNIEVFQALNFQRPQFVTKKPNSKGALELIDEILKNH